MASRVPYRPAHAPTDRSACADVPGTKAWRSSSNLTRPCDWLNRCTAGFQPPATASRSASTCRAPTWTPFSTPSASPVVPVTTCPSTRGSTISAISTPAAARSRAASWPESVHANTTARRQGATPYRLA